MKAFQRRLLVLDQRDDDVAIIGGRGFADDDHVTVIYPGLDHRIAFDLKRVMRAARRKHLSGNRDVMIDMADRFDRDPGGDLAHHGQFAGKQLNLVPGDICRLRGGGMRSVDHAGRESGGWGTAHGFGQFHDLDGACPMREAADEAALFKGGDQTVNAGFGAQIQRILHLVKAGRDAIALHACVDEFQQVELFPGQHDGPSE